MSHGFGAGGLSRRSFIKGTAGAVAVTIAPVGRGVGLGAAPVSAGTLGTAGVATQRIDGVAKVTGQKVFARDFYPRDMAGWPTESGLAYAYFVNATTTTRQFLSVNMDMLGDLQSKVQLFYGSDLSPSMRQPVLSARRDLHLDEKIADLQAKEQTAARLSSGNGSFDKPDSLEFDLIVQPGAQPDFLGQAVALLVCEDFRTFKALKTKIQFQDDAFQNYGPEIGPNPDGGKDFTPLTNYVKNGDFSYATADPSTYDAQSVVETRNIQAWIQAQSDLQSAALDSEMAAMDPMFMEPETGLAYLDTSGEGVLNVVLGTQSPDHDVEDIVSMYGSTDSPAQIAAVKLTSCYPGGGFGGRDKSPFSLMLALAAGMSPDKPIRLELDRYQQFQTGLKRHACKVEGTVWVDSTMKIQALTTTMDFDGGGRKNLSPYVANLAGLCVGGSYKVPRADIKAHAYQSQNVPGGSQRGFGGPQAFFAIETALDGIASDNGWDPFDLRRANLVDLRDTTVVGGPIDQVLRLSHMLDLAEQHPLWQARRAGKRVHAAQGRLYGTGMAMSLQAYGTSGDGVVAAVKIERDGSITVETDAVDMGNGSATTLGVVVGPIIGANADRVRPGDYHLFPKTQMIEGTNQPEGVVANWTNPKWTPKGVGSSSACLTGLHQVNVTQQTATALMRIAVLPAAAILWGMAVVHPDQAYWQDGLLHSTNPVKPLLHMSELAKVMYKYSMPTGVLGHAFFQGDWAKGTFDIYGASTVLELDGLAVFNGTDETPTPIWRTSVVQPPEGAGRWSRSTWAPCVNVVSVSVDPTTYEVRVENVLSVLNAGRVHVPELVSGQSQGGVAMSIGYTLMEDAKPGPKGPADGTWNLDQYHVPRFADVPLRDGIAPGARGQELILVQPLLGEKAAGRGIAEAVMCSIPPAIANALYDAIGARFRSLPITRDDIKKVLGQ